ncbi:MAG TPA: amidohydrolase family protein, partial [Gemmatimonadaceae bacterium]|nr:amidohydrolase family protein [Gemmatimonadaceae bacterium]
MLRVSLLLLLAYAHAATGQTPPTAAPPISYVIRAAHMIDGKSDAIQSDVAVVVQGDRIVAAGPRSQVDSRIPAGAQTVDLGTATILPGLIDNHTHVLLQGDITSADYDDQLLKESIPYRAIRAAAAVRVALMNGFTTIRDLESEGAMYADVDVKTAIARGVIPGPRMFVSTRAMSTTGTYPLLGYSWELKMPEGVQIVDGPEEVRKAVREQAKYGADWIKFYADRRYYVGSDGRLRSWVNFTDEELKMLVSEAHRLGKKVAAHAIGWDGIDAALRAGVNSIEHGDGLTDDLLDRMIAQKVYWCPTIFVGAYVASGRG